LIEIDVIHLLKFSKFLKSYLNIIYDIYFSIISFFILLIKRNIENNNQFTKFYYY